tara:strand:+ start:1824 stop:2132 length:309 start_codon:yes stop_codon:yes gene_type:complete
MGVNSRSPIIGGSQHALTVDSTAGGITLTVPGSANTAEIFVETAPIRFTRDGTAPTTTVGFVAYPGDIITLNSRKELINMKMIEDTTTDASVEVEYFTDVSG